MAVNVTREDEIRDDDAMRAPPIDESAEQKLEREILEIDSKRREVNIRLRELDVTRKGGKGFGFGMGKGFDARSPGKGFDGFKGFDGGKGFGGRGSDMGGRGPEISPRGGSDRRRDDDRRRDEGIRRNDGPLRRPEPDRRDADESSPRKRARTEVDVDDLASPKGPRSTISSVRSPSEKEADRENKPSPRVKMDEKAKKRSNRLLGNLLTGTLSRFKKDATKAASRQAKHEQKKLEVMQRIREKEMVEREDVREERRKMFQDQRQRELKERNELARMQATKEFELLTLKWSNHRESLIGYIRTKTGPPIFWCPAEHTDETKELLEGMPMTLASETTELRELAEKHFLGEQEKFSHLHKNPQGTQAKNEDEDDVQTEENEGEKEGEQEGEEQDEKEDEEEDKTSDTKNEAKSDSEGDD